MKHENMRMTIAREAARRFLSDGVAATSGDEIAKSVGVAARTVWRHFRNKENCVAPLLAASIARFARVLRLWKLDVSLENHLRVAMPLDWETQQTIADGALAVRLVALTATEPDIRAVWFDAYHQLEADLLPIVAERCNRSTQDFDVRLCAATVVAAIRVVDETVSTAAMSGERSFSSDDLVEIMAGAMRAAATLPICDPVPQAVFGAFPRRSGAAD